MDPTPAPSGQPNSPPAGSRASGRAVVALALGIASCFLSGFLTGVPAIILGRMEEKAIIRGEAPVEGRTFAKMGWILGLIGSILWCVAGLAIQLSFLSFAWFSSKMAHPTP